MTYTCDHRALVRRETLEALPATLTMLRRLFVSSFEAGDPETDELRSLLDACVVGAHRLRLREQLRSREAYDPG
ncbi:MAG TPA: hypothetical protein VMT68_16235 [Caulobacteraceae bacterium]|nr:hypothetical protein [Caulobacteraceae bacterium]